MPLISNADSIKVGSVTATAVYLGTTLVWPSSPAGIMVSGAGLSAANGLYTYGGTYSGAPYYVNTLNDYQIYLSAPVNGTWVIELEGPNGSTGVYETNETNLTSPVDGTWTAPYGDTPVPTVERAYSPVVSGAGSAGANGTYTYGGVYNNYPYYTKGFYSIERSSSGVNGVWVIYNEATNLYENNLTGLTPPYNITNPWTRSFTQIFGDLPVPTVSHS